MASQAMQLAQELVEETDQAVNAELSSAAHTVQHVLRLLGEDCAETLLCVQPWEKFKTQYELHVDVAAVHNGRLQQDHTAEETARLQMDINEAADTTAVGFFQFAEANASRAYHEAKTQRLQRQAGQTQTSSSNISEQGLLLRHQSLQQQIKDLKDKRDHLTRQVDQQKAEAGLRDKCLLLKAQYQASLKRAKHRIQVKQDRLLATLEHVAVLQLFETCVTAEASQLQEMSSLLKAVALDLTTAWQRQQARLQTYQTHKERISADSTLQLLRLTQLLLLPIATHPQDPLLPIDSTLPPPICKNLRVLETDAASQTVLGAVQSLLEASEEGHDKLGQLVQELIAAHIQPLEAAVDQTKALLHDSCSISDTNHSNKILSGSLHKLRWALLGAGTTSTLAACHGN